MNKICGDYIEKFDPELDSLEMSFTPSTHSSGQRWTNNRLSAQFVGDYFSAFLPTDKDNRECDRILGNRITHAPKLLRHFTGRLEAID